MIKALALLPASVRLRVAGYETIGARGYIAELERRAAELGVSDRFEYVGLLPERSELLALLDAIAPLGRRWFCQISIDVARDEALLDRVAAAGCAGVLIGFESLNEASLAQMNKSWNSVSGSYARVVRALHQRGIAIYGTFVLGYDADTRETIERTLDFALESRLAAQAAIR